MAKVTVQTIRDIKGANLNKAPKKTTSSSGVTHGGNGARRTDNGTQYAGPTNKSYHGPTTIPANGGRPAGPSSSVKLTGSAGSSGSTGTMSGSTGSAGGTSSGSSGSYSYSGSGNADVSGMLQDMYEQQYAAQQEAQQRLSDQLKAQQEEYAAQLRAQQEAQRQAAQNAYNNNMSALESAYAKRLSGLDSNLETTKNQLASSYNNSRTSLGQNEENALREAYINRMMNEKNLRQQLNAQGLTGGASESAIASMLNNYGTSRNNINTTAANNLRELEQTYNGNLASAQQNYNDAVNSANDSNMAYRMQLENDLANNTVSSYENLYNALAGLDSNYTNAMTNLITNQSAANSDLQNIAFKAMLENAMAPTTISVSGSNRTSSSGNGSGTTMAKRVKNMFSNGSTVSDIAKELQTAGYSVDAIEQIFAEAGLNY